MLERIVAGRLNKQIADDLGISIKTVEAHRANVMEKLNANTVADLLKIALGGQRLKPAICAKFHEAEHPTPTTPLSQVRFLLKRPWYDDYKIIDGNALSNNCAAGTLPCAPPPSKPAAQAWLAVVLVGDNPPAQVMCATRSRPARMPACTRCWKSTMPP